MRILPLFLFVLIIISTTSCDEPLTDEEKLFLKKINQEYSSKYKIDSYGTYYLRIFAINEINEEDIKTIFRKFHKKSKAYGWVYVNVYDNKKKFQYQLVYDILNGDFKKSYREYY